MNKYKQTLERIAQLSEISEIRGGLSDIGVPSHLIKEGGWVPIHPQFKAGLEYAAKMAKECLEKS